MGRVQFIANLLFIFLIVLAFKWASSQTAHQLSYQHRLIALLDRYIANQTLAPEDFPQELAAKKLEQTQNTESFLKILQLGYQSANQPEGLALNNRQHTLNSGEVLSILLSGDPTSQKLQALQRQYLEKQYGQIFAAKQRQICIITHVEKELSEQNAKKLITSIIDQHYQKYNLVYVDDATPGNSFITARAYIYDLHPEKLGKQFIFQMNKEAAGLLTNTKSLVHKYCSADDIVLLLQGSQSLVGPNVLKMINYMFSKSPEVWTASAEELAVPFYEVKTNQLDSEDVKDRKLRQKGAEVNLQGFVASLLQKIPEESLTNPITKQYFRTEAAAALFYSLIELSGTEHHAQMREILMRKVVESERAEAAQQRKAVRQIISGVPVAAGK